MEICHIKEKRTKTRIRGRDHHEEDAKLCFLILEQFFSWAETHRANYPGRGDSSDCVNFSSNAGVSLANRPRLLHQSYYICPSALCGLRDIKSDTWGPRWGEGVQAIALLSPLYSTGESAIKVCGLSKFTAVRLKRQLVCTAHLVPHVCRAVGTG